MNNFVRKVIGLSFRYGVIASLILAIGIFILPDPISSVKRLDLFIIPIFIFFTLKEYRDIYRNRLLEYREGMALGLSASFWIGLFSGIILWVYISWIRPSAMDEYRENRKLDFIENKEKLISQSGQDTFDQELNEIATYKISTIIVDDMVKKFVIGFILTIMMSVILRKLPPKNVSHESIA